MAEFLVLLFHLFEERLNYFPQVRDHVVLLLSRLGVLLGHVAVIIELPAQIVTFMLVLEVQI